MKIEQKVITVASTLANIDSNIKNLQERAHVWDTFQLHVSAWNEQISTLDKRVEIISKYDHIHKQYKGNYQYSMILYLRLVF